MSPTGMPSPPLWGQAAPDASGCWGMGFTFELCCVNWSTGGGSDDAGLSRECWAPGFSQERCCTPREVPRDLFACRDRGKDWVDFRKDLMLGKDVKHTNLPAVLGLRVEQCLLGALIAALVHACHLCSTGKHALDCNRAFTRADDIFKLVLETPVSFDEIVASGWSFGQVLQMLSSLSWWHGRLGRLGLPGGVPMSAMSSMESRVVLAITEAFQAVDRVPMDILLEALAPGPPAEQYSVGVRTAACWTAAYNIRCFDGPRTPPAFGEGQRKMSKEAARLMALGESWLRPRLLESAHGPLTELLSRHLMVVDVLQVLGWVSVVTVDPLSLFNYPGLPAALRPATGRRRPEPFVLHVLPTYDSVSNMVRASWQPFCYETAFLSTVAWIASKAGRLGLASTADTSVGQRQPRVHIVEAGANFGDCSLWAASLLSSAGIPARIDAVEPLPAVAAALRHSAAGVCPCPRSPSEEELSSDCVCSDFRVHNLALGDVQGPRQLGIPGFAHAETSSACQGRYSRAESIDGTIGCRFFTARGETLDRLLANGEADMGPGVQASQGMVDILKIHVQGDEPRVLAGSQRVLATGRICVVLLKAFSSGLASSASAAAGQMHALLQGYSILLLTRNATPSESSPLAEGVQPHVEARARQATAAELEASIRSSSQGEDFDVRIVAYRGDGRCRGSPAVAAVRSLWPEGGPDQGQSWSRIVS